MRALQDDYDQQLAVVFLQQVIRGRAIQNMVCVCVCVCAMCTGVRALPLFAGSRAQMQEAKDKRLELIRELRSTHALQESGLAVKSNEAATIGACAA